MGVFDDLIPGGIADSQSSGGAFDDLIPKKKQNKGIAGDLATDLKRGVEQLPGIVTGLADIPIAAVTGESYADKAANALGGITGFAPAKWAKEAEAEYSPARQTARQNVDQAWKENESPFSDAAKGDFTGIGNVAKSYIENPQQLVGSVVESLPSMVGGAKVGQALTKAAGFVAPTLAGAVGEGGVMAGQQMNQLTEAGADPRTAAAAAAATGIAGGVIGALGGKLAQRMGVVDPDTALAGGATRAVAGETGEQTIKGALMEGAKRITGGSVSEGLFEELPQSALEQVLSNLAQGKPWEEGLARAAVEGTLAGSLMGGAFNALPGKKAEDPATKPPAADDKPEIAGLLPAPTYTGTPGEQVIAADAERQAAIDAADANAEKLYAEREAYAKWQEELKRNNITIVNDPEPLQQRIDALMGINESRLQGFARTNYEKAIENAFGEQIGFVVGKDGLEVPFTMGDYLKSKIAVGDMERKGQGKKAPSAGIAAAPVIPVVGPLSAVANVAVQSGAHQAAVVQQAAAQAAENTPPEGKAGTPAGAQSNAAAPAQGPLTEVAAQAAPTQEPVNVAQSAQATPQAVQANDAPAGSAPVAAPATSQGQGTGESIDLSKRTDAQLNWLTTNGKPGFKEAAVAEIQKRSGVLAAPQASNSETVPALNAVNSGNSQADAVQKEYELAKQAWASSHVESNGVRLRAARKAMQEANPEFDDDTTPEQFLADGSRLAGVFDSRKEAFAAMDAYYVASVVPYQGKFLLYGSKPKSAPDVALIGEGNIKQATEQKAEKTDDVTTVPPALEEIAKRLGVQIVKAKRGFHTSADGMMVNVPTEDRDAEGAVSAGHILAHELGHAVLKARTLDFSRIPGKTIAEQYIPNWLEFVGASKEFRPGVWNHADENIRKHAKKPNEIIADVIASVLMGQRPVSILQGMMKQTGTSLVDLGLQTVEEANAEYAKKKDADQVPVKNEAPTAATVSASEASAEQEPIKKTGAALPNATAPEHVETGVDDRELGQIVAEFNAAQKAMVDGDDKVTHIFDAPAKSEIVRLADKAKVYHKDHGWMTVEEAKAQIAEWKAKTKAQGNDALKNGNANRVVLSLFDLTGSWSKPWEEAGYQVYRFDIQNDPVVGDVNNFSADFFGDWFGDFDGQDVYAILAATPCTDFAVSGARHFAAKDADGRTVASVKLVHQTLAAIEYFKPAVWALENPVGRIEKLGGLPPWRLSFDPNHLGDPYTKKTILWGRFNGDLPVAPVEPTEGSKMHTLYGGKSLATKNARSATPEGFSYGFFMANNAADHPAMAIANKYDRLDSNLIQQAVDAGVTEEQIDSAVEDFYFMDLDDEAANQAIRDLLPTEPKPEPKPTGAELLKQRIASDKAKAGDTDNRFAKNTIFTADRVAEAKARMKAKLGTINSGIDPELLIDGMTIAGAYIESGVRKFADYAKAMVEDLGDGVKPYLLSFYEAARAYPGLNKLGMDSAEAAAAQHQALLTPEVKEAAKAVIGEATKVEKKKPANLGEAVRLKADWGVPNIDGYTPSKTGKNQQTDFGMKGGVKDEFLADASRYLKAVAKLLEDQGFTAHTDSKGRAMKMVSANEGGPAVGGDVSLVMRQGDFGIYAQVGVTNVRGMGPDHPQGVSLMVRTTTSASKDRYATGTMNYWLPLDMSSGELAAWFEKRSAAVDIPAASTTLEVKNEQSAPEPAPAIGEANNGTATGKQGDPVLEGLATETVQGTSGSEPTGDGGSGSGSGRNAGNQGTDAGRGTPGRSGGSGTAEVDTAAAGGTGPAGTGLGNNGTGRPGSGVSTSASKPRARGEGRESSVPEVKASDVPAIPEANFEITEDVALGSGGQMTKYRDNVAAIKVLKTIEAERRRATAAEKKLLARYVGWGGIPNAFRNGITGQVAKDWEAEVAELEALLSPKELRAASASTRNAHYTAKEVVDFMWSVVKKSGFDGGLVLEPSVGTGNFIGLMPKELSGRSFVTGVELDSLTARIASALYPKSAIVNTGFQKAALPSNRFKLAIGNPPFGAESLRFQFRPELNNASIHNQFFLGSLDSVEPGGMMTMVVSRYLLDAKDATSREKLAIDAKLLGAVRLPGSAFKGNALTEVVTDILFFRKRDPAEAQLLREAFFKRGKQIKGKDAKAIAEHQAEQTLLEAEMRWTKTGEMKDPLGGEPMVVSQYFIDRPSMVIGTMDRSGSMRQGGDIEVTLPKGEKLADRLNALLDKMADMPVQSMTDEALANAEKFHKAMGESLKLSATGAEADAITFDEDGDLSTVVERVGPTGETALSPLKITPATPWSTQLQMDLDGKWFREVVKTDKAGKPVKALDAKGNETKRNVYVREVFKKESDIPKGLLLGEARYAKMKNLISMRDLFVNQIDLEVSRATPEQMEANRAELRAAYESFVKANGFISDQKNASIISDMPDEGLLMSLEMSYKPEITAAKAASTGMPAAPASAKPAAILSRPVAIPPADKTSADSAVDGLAISLSETGRIDIARIAELRGLSEEAATEELIGGDSPMAFKDPENGNELTEKNSYLSGNVRRKLEAAKLANMTANVKALEAVQPEPWSSDKVTARAGANWIPVETYGEFLSGLLGEKASVQYSKLTNTFEVRAKGDSAAATATWGTKRESAVSLFQDILNSRSTRVVDRDMDGNAVFNQVDTDAANDKRKEIVEAFNDWIFKDPDRRGALTKQFNDTFNTRVTPQYDGSHLAFPGKVPDEIISLRRGQVNAVWRGIIDDAVLYDHAVGAGKTFTGIARAMERRRMGMSKKPMIVVPNHMVGEWAAQAYRLYPGARVLAATKKDLESKNRRRLFAKIASGDWDMVIVPHSSFQFIAISPETEERLLMEELSLANAALKDAEAEAEPGSRFKPLSVKAAEALIEKIEKRLEAARGRLGKDKLLTFEQMGVDDLTIDESHEFKNLFYSSNLTDVRGMGNKTGSDKAFDLYSKTRVIREMGGSLAFLTGTPISNSAVEAYNILRYLAPESLKESGLEHFDAFRSQYVDATAKFEPTDSGGGLKLVTRLGRSWSNMRSLMELYYSVADVVTNDDIKRWYAEDNPGKEFPLPKVKSGDRIPVSVDATPTQLRLLKETIEAFEGLDGIEDVKERNAERLRLMDRARKLSLHAKAVDPSLDDEPGGKLDKVAEKAAEIYRKSMADKGTQLIFLDRGVPKAKGDDKIIKEYDDLTAKLRQASLANNEEEARKLVSRLDKFDANEIEELRAAQNNNWSGYQHIKDRLIEQGVPANEIAFVQDFNGDAAKEQLFQAVRDGAIRILIGSTPRMGAGTNVQERLVALHHVDATWKPSDIEQREGRIIRQGNVLAFDSNGNPRPGFEVEIYAYVTKRTVDAKLWDLNATKLRMINAIRYYDGQFEMDFDDEAAVGMAEIAAIASGDPLLLERFKLSTEIDNLYRAKSSHRRRVESADDSLRSAKRLVENAPAEIAESKEDAKLRAEFAKAVKESTDTREVTIAGKRYVFGDMDQLNKDYAKIVEGIGEDEKFSLVVDGKEYTSKSAAEEAIKDAMGDREPFVAEVDGKTITRRSDYARAIREKIGDEVAEGQEIKATPMGTIGGIPVSVEVGSNYGGPAIFLGLTGKYEATGRRRSVVGNRYLAPEKHKKGDPYPLSVNALRPVISDFEKSVSYLWDNSESIAAKAEKAKQEIPAFEAQIAEKFKGQEELDAKSDRLATVEAELSGRKTEEEAKDAKPEEEGAGNIAAPGSMSPADKAVYGMAAEGKSAADILKFIASASRNPFYRQVAKLLLKTGINPSITVGDGKGWKFNAGEGNKYAAGYNPESDTVSLFRPASAERNMIHELIHAATLKALSGKGMAAAQMSALYQHVKKTGKLKGMYGMANMDEFVAEAFSNPKFQARLKLLAAPKASTGKVSSAWDWFVRVVRGILGLKPNDDNALAQALEIGVDVMRANMKADDVGGGIRYNIAGDHWDVSEPSKMDDVIYALQDKHIDTKRVMQAIMASGKRIRDNFNAYLQEELFHGRAAKGVKDFLDFELRPLLKEMQAAKVDMGDFEEYLWNRHAEERNKQIAKINPEMPDGGSGIETAAARAYIASIPLERKKLLEQLAARVEAINRSSQKVLVESGLEKQSTIDAWNNAYQHYVPLQREDVDNGHVGTGKGFSVRGSSTKRAMGSGKKVVDIIANLTMQRERNIVRSEKNRVSKAVMGLAMENPNPDFWTVDKAPKERVVEAKIIYTVLDKDGNKIEEFTRDADAEKLANKTPGATIDVSKQDRVEERVVPGFTSRDNVLLTRINGKDHYVIFNESNERAMRMAMAMKNLDVDNLGRVLSLVGKATRYLSAINTQYNPVFGVINLIRDAQGALLNLSSTPLAGDQKRVLGYTKDALIGIYKDIRAHRAGKVPSSNWAALFEEFQKEGGQTGYRDQYANAEARAEAIQSELSQFKEGKAKQLTRGLFGWLSDYNETMENAVRLAAYKAAKEKGMSKQQAASLAKNITVNFNRKGQMATQVGALYAFFNASVQGTARIAQTLFDMKDGDIRTARLSKTGKKIVYGGIMLGSMQALLLAAAGFDDDEPPEFVRERNLILPIGEGKYLTLAMPLGFHVLPGMGRIATEFVMSGGKDPIKKLAAFGSMFAESFNPVGSSGWSLQTITPSVVDPFAALAENRDFTGKEIYREDFNKLNPTPGHTRAKDTASIWSKAISEGLNFITGGSEYKPGLFSPTPDQIDYLIGQATGGVGREVSKVSQTASATATGEDLPLYKVPLFGRFVGDTGGKAGESAKFYDHLREINMHEAEYKGLIKDGKRQEAAEYLAENPGVKFIMFGNTTERAVKKLREAKRGMIERGESPEKVSEMDARIAATMKRFNERVGAVLE